MREGGELADILARLKQELGLGGGTLTLRGLSGGSISASGKYARAGGVAGDNSSTCTIKTCTVIVSGEISATTKDGDVVGNNNGEIIEQG